MRFETTNEASVSTLSTSIDHGSAAAPLTSNHCPINHGKTSPPSPAPPMNHAVALPGDAEPALEVVQHRRKLGAVATPISTAPIHTGAVLPLPMTITAAAATESPHDAASSDLGRTR